MTHRREFIGMALAGSIGLIAGCVGGGRNGSGSVVEETTSVSMTQSQFDPRNIHVDAGATVTWTNESGVDHTVTNASENWSGDTVVASGEEATEGFETAGVYEVYCSFHGAADLSGMSMKVAVGDATIEEPLDTSSSDGGGGGY